MKKTLIFIGLILAIASVWFSLARFVMQQDAVLTPLAIETSRYSSEEFSLAFTYPSLYELRKEPAAVVLVSDTDPNRSEGPTAITVQVFPNGDAGYSAEGFATSTSESNLHLGNGIMSKASVAGEAGVSYSWSGLYEGRSVVIARPQHVYLFSVTSLAPEDQIIRDFDALIATVAFSADHPQGWGSYSNAGLGFDAKIPQGFAVNEAYFNYTLGPGREIPGVSFTIPASLAEGTNLSDDTRISVEMLSRAACRPSDFISTTSKGTPITVGQNSYVYAVSSGAGAGNRYEESIYVTKQREICYGVRFFIHSTALENYDPGTRTAFDRDALIGTFKGIMQTIRFI